MAQRYKIKELPAEERPRERLRNWGASALSNSELLAILLSSGTKGEPVTDLAKRMLTEHGGLLGLMKLDVSELEKIHGLGPAKASGLKAALELGSRLNALGPDERPNITSPDDVAYLVSTEMMALDREELRVVLLDTRNRVLGTKTVYQGTVNQANVRTAEVFADAVRRTATAIVVVHNHPSGDPTPSAEDVALTAELVKAGQLLDIKVHDHLIIGRNRHVSMRRLGLGFDQSIH